MKDSLSQHEIKPKKFFFIEKSLHSKFFKIQDQLHEEIKFQKEIKLISLLPITQFLYPNRLQLWYFEN